jgi:hypothetical protein
MKTSMNRRDFLGHAAVSAAALTIVPRHVLGGPNTVAPSDKIVMALIGCGSEGLVELPALLQQPEVHIAAVCDPNRESTDYVEWGKDSVRSQIGEEIGFPEWRIEGGGVPGGRVVGKEIVDLVYGRSPSAKGGCRAYHDFRKLLEKEKDVDAVKIMTPDHLHATIAIAAMKKGKHVLLHKPLANRVTEARMVIETAKKTGVVTHFLPLMAGQQVSLAMQWIRDGVIGTLREIHNWSNRPLWPQYQVIPADRPAIPKGFDWKLWLGPSLDRPYHPHYTHAVFRGWYEFGGGAIADMGHYSLCRVFQALDLDAPVSVETTPSHACALEGNVSRTIENDYSFPTACTIRFRFAARADRPAVDLFWYDGGMKPRIPEELEAEGRTLRPEGMLFVGDNGKILAGFNCESPRLIPEQKHRETFSGQEISADRLEEDSDVNWIEAFRGGKPTIGDFTLNGPISEAFNLAAISLRLGGAKLVWDEETMSITNRPEDNRYLTREYRKGWEI